MPRTPEVCPTAFCPLSHFSKPSHRLKIASRVLLTLLLLLGTQHSALITVHAQSATATLSGTVVDQNGDVVPDVDIAVISIAQGFQRTATTKEQGTFVVPLLPPGNYTVKAERQGFTPAEIRDVVLNVNDQVAIRIHMKVGTLSQTIEIVEGGSLINESPAVGTVVDRAQVENMPLNGRSFQSLITLSPGVVLTKAGAAELGQFSVNGQRADANYFTVDGVSANIGVIAANTGQAVGGTLPGFSVSGGTNNLVSVDALQEFKIQTSTYSAEFGRQPGAQVQVATRSGTNDFHGMLFDYFRNDVFDANDWFANRSGLKKSALRQNDFGGVFGGPILLPRFGEGGQQPWYNGRNRTFFFVSYEGLRLRQPQFLSTSVPTVAARQSAPTRLQPYLNIFPLPNGPNLINPVTGLPNGYAQFNASFSVPATLNATSFRIDHTVSGKLTLFARYNYAPSETASRGTAGSLSVVNPVRNKTETLTGGVTSVITPKINNDFRINFSRNSGRSSFHVDNFGGAVRPDDAAILPSFTSSQDAQLVFILADAISTSGSFFLGSLVNNLQRQYNIVDNLSMLAGSHQLKFGIDYRRLSPVIGPRRYLQQAVFSSLGVGVPTPPAGSVFSGIPLSITVGSEAGFREPVFTNLSLYGQDSWRVNRRLVLTYGMRWEFNPPPKEKNGNNPATVMGLDNLPTLSLASFGTPLFPTTYNNFAPRIGAAYQLFQQSGREMVLRGGFGVFYDLGTGTAGASYQAGVFPYAASRLFSSTAFPLTAAQAAPPTVNLTSPSLINVVVFDQNFKLPRTLQWSVAIQQSLGANQTMTASYVGADGRQLLRQERIISPNPTFNTVTVTRNAASSDFHAAQFQFQRRLSNRFQALASYQWAKSLDNISADSVSNLTPAARIDPQLDRGPSDFDVRHSFNAAVTYDIPSLRKGTIGNEILGGWSIDTIVTARSATPVNVTITRNIGFGSYAFRPDLVPGIPLYLNDSNAPGGRRLNNTPIPGNTRQLGPFSVPTDLRQGTLGRNALRGLPVWQTDFTLRRRVNLTERINLQIRWDIFNVFNHPNFGDPNGILGNTLPNSSQFGISPSMWGKSLGAGGSVGGFNPLYQVGGPRSMQFSLKLQF